MQYKKWLGSLSFGSVIGGCSKNLAILYPCDDQNAMSAANSMIDDNAQHEVMVIIASNGKLWLRPII